MRKIGLDFTIRKLDERFLMTHSREYFDPAFDFRPLINFKFLQFNKIKNCIKKNSS